MEYLKRRLAKIQEELVKSGNPVCLVSDPSNVTYLTGIPYLSRMERDALLVLTSQKAFVFVSPLKLEQFHSLEHIRVVAMEKGTLSKKLNAIIGEEEKQRIEFEAGDLRVSELEKIKEKVTAEFVSAEGRIEHMRRIKNWRELEKIAKACKIAGETWGSIRLKIKPGLSEKQVAQLIITEMTDRGAEATPYGFDPIVASGPNSAIPHYVTGHRKLEKNDVVLVDYGCTIGGYCSDITRMIVIGDLSADFTAAKQAVRKAYSAALNSLSPGIKCRRVDAAARKVLREEGMEEGILHGVGHGLGLDIHEPPSLHLKSGPAEQLQQNMVVTIEPGVYFPGKFGYRYENTVQITEKGYRVLT